ncbi:hypothetical protein [Dysgonomonas sp. 25]|uniref:hypothetical protein n=1 Tax=Dysgonomonas sp. 25 TaxID=2302933 RepID=UPI0013D1B673|nr:hypothetical protein [Dysgonomonas sp. 25]
MSWLRSHAAWFFSAYLIVFFIFKLHKNISVSTVASYLVAAIILQGICTLLIAYVPFIKDILTSLELDVAGWDSIREENENQRLIGYGMGFFGAGYMYGYGLIFTIYIMARAKIRNKKTMFFLAIVYAFIFYVGIFTARTVVIGAAVSVAMMGIFYIKDYRRVKRRGFQFIIYFAFLAIIGYSAMYAYFPHMADWAFELFINLSQGEVKTNSSDGLEHMFSQFPSEDMQTLFFGTSSLGFFGNDVGFIRLIYHSGLFGLIAFYGVSVATVYGSISKDWHTNLMLILLVIYEWVVNIKGLADMHSVLFVFFFFFMFYKYYKFQPMLYAQHLEERKKRLENLNFK